MQQTFVLRAKFFSNGHQNFDQNTAKTPAKRQQNLCNKAAKLVPKGGKNLNTTPKNIICTSIISI
jgi:hypothetical protein